MKKTFSDKDYKKFYNENKSKFFMFENFFIIIFIGLFILVRYILNLSYNELMNILKSNLSLFSFISIFIIFILKIFDTSLNDNIINSLVHNEEFFINNIIDNLKNRNKLFSYVEINIYTFITSIVLKFILLMISFIILNLSPNNILFSILVIINFILFLYIDSFLYTIDKIYLYNDKDYTIQDVFMYAARKLSENKSFLLNSIFKVMFIYMLIININVVIFNALLYYLPYKILPFLMIRFIIRKKIEKRIRINILLIKEDAIKVFNKSGDRVMLHGKKHKLLTNK